MIACEKLFKYVSLWESEEIETIYEKDIICHNEDAEMFKRYFNNLGDARDIVFNNLEHLDIKEMFYELMLEGEGLSQESNFPSDEHFTLRESEDMSVDRDLNISEESSSSDSGEDKDKYLNNVDLSVFTVSQEFMFEETEWNWTTQNILLSIKLLSIIKDPKLAAKLTRDISKISHINTESILRYIRSFLNELRQLYFACLRETANKVLGHKRITGLIAEFTCRRLSEVRDNKNMEETEEENEQNEVITELNAEEFNFEEFKCEPLHVQIFYKWLSDEAIRVKSHVPKAMQRMLRELKEEASTIEQNIIPDEIQDSLYTLDNPSFYDFLKGYYNEKSFMDELTLISNWKESSRILCKMRVEVEEKIFNSWIKLHKSTKKYNLNDIANVLGRSLMRNKYNILNLLKVKIARILNTNSYLHETISFSKEWSDALKQWNNEYLKLFKNYSVCGICFMKIFRRAHVRIQLVKSELYLLKRLWKHHQIFKRERWKGEWVDEYEANKLFRSEYENTIIDEKDKDKPIGFTICSYWKTSFREEQRYRKMKNSIPYCRFDRKKIGEVDFDFWNVPSVIKKVPKMYLDHIQFGMVYLKPNSQNALRMMMVTGDTGYRLSNGSIGVMRKLGLKKVKDNSKSEQKIIDAIKWLKENNPLAKTYLTLYESNAILDLIERNNRINEEKVTDDYYIVDEIDQDRQVHQIQILDKLGRKYAISKEIFKSLKDNLEKRKEINDRWLVLYNDYYLEEKLFVHLFPYGTGGYNSTFCKIMDFSHYIRMRLCSGYTDRFRKDKEYIFFLYDWAKKLQIYRSNFIIHRMMVSEFEESKIPEEELLPIKSKSDYFKRFGAKLPQNLRNWTAYKRNRFYEVQTIIQNYGMPNLFVTVRMNPVDIEGDEYISQAFNLDQDKSRSLVDYVVEYSVYFKNKINFLRNLFKKRKDKTIFGNIIASWDVIEYTSSGIPHLHALIWLAEEHKYLASIEGNKLVYTTKVNPRNPNDTELNNLIEMYQIHQWIREKCNIRKNGEHVNFCLNGYPFKPIERDSICKENNRILYRRDVGDEYVSPYNPELLKIAKWPINVQIVTSDSVAVYLSKYITKVNKLTISDQERWNKISRDVDEEFTEVERYFMERKVGSIEAWNDLLYFKHYNNSPTVTNFNITLPSERIWALIAYKELIKIIEENKDSGKADNGDSESDDDQIDNLLPQNEEENDNLPPENEEESDDEDYELEKEGIFKPGNWENYLCRSKALETLTFPEMLTNYKWWSRFDLVPNRWKIPDENGNFTYWEQLPVKVLVNRFKKWMNNLSRSSTLNDIIKTHMNINLTEKYQTAKYWFKRKNPLLFNWRYRYQNKQSELFWFIELLDREHFRYFDELLSFEGRVYQSFFSAWRAKGYWVEVNENEKKLDNRFDIGGLERTIHDISNGKIMLSYEDIKVIILKLVQTIQLKNSDVWNARLKELSIQYYNKFPLLFDEIQKSSLIRVKDDPIEIFKSDTMWDTWWKVSLIMEWSYKKFTNQTIKIGSDIDRVWSHFHRFEPVITEKLQANLELFMERYLNFAYYTASQKVIISYFIKNLFNPTRNWYFITGFAGCGKSFLLRELVFLFRNVLNLNVLVCATTGTAAKEIDGVTVHRAFKYNSKDVGSFPLPGTSHFENLKRQDIIIIDEVSMMTGEWLEFIDASWRNAGLYSRYRLDNMDKPFGGKMIILFGDLLQIPWVQEELVGTKLRIYRKLKDTYIFKAFQWLFLLEQKRQSKDDNYFQIWKAIALGDINKNVLEWLSTRVWRFFYNDKAKLMNYLKSEHHTENVKNIEEWKESNPIDITWVASTNKIRREINKHRQNVFIKKNNTSKDHVFKAIYYSRMHEIKDEETLKYLKTVYSDEHSFEEMLVLRVGAKVILNINIDVKRGLTNGTTGTIKAIEENIIHFEYKFKEQTHVAFITRIDKEDTVPYLHITRSQFPISLAYWLTMHKWQGQTLKGVVIKWDEIQTEGLFYSILARWKNAERIHIKNLIVNEHILTDAETVKLVKEKEREFIDNFVYKDDKYGKISDTKKALTVIRETKISLAYFHHYLYNIVHEKQQKWDDLYKGIRDINKEFYNVVFKKITERHRIMMSLYNESLIEQSNHPNMEIDWRNKFEYDCEELMKDLLNKTFNRELLDLELDEWDEDLVNGILQDSDDIEEILMDTEKEETKEDMDVEASIHDPKEDGKIPWWFWRADIRGFDSLLLLFYYNVYRNLGDPNEKSFLKTFSPFQTENKMRYNGIIRAWEKLVKIHPFLKYPTEARCERLQSVIKPWMDSLKLSDRIEQLFDWFDKRNYLFWIKYREIIECHGKWLPNQNTSINKSASLVLNCIKLKDMWYSRPAIKEISSNILETSLLRDKFAKCPQCGSKLMSIRIVPVQFPKFLWIVNDQDPVLSSRKIKSFYVDLEIEMGQVTKFTYNLRGIIFKHQYSYSSWVKIDIEGSDEWYSYDGEQDKSMMEKIDERFGTNMHFNYRSIVGQSNKWPVVFLYQRGREHI